MTSREGEKTLDDLLARTEPNGSCLEWQGARSSDGYGSVWIRGIGMRGAHRVAFSLAHKDPGDLHVLHKCDNPPCINPDHLHLGTHADNMREMSARGRAKSHKPKKLTQELADQIRAEFQQTSTRKTNAKALAAKYGVSAVMICGIARGRFWKP